MSLTHSTVLPRGCWVWFCSVPAFGLYPVPYKEPAGSDQRPFFFQHPGLTLTNRLSVGKPTAGHRHLLPQQMVFRRCMLPLTLESTATDDHILIYLIPLSHSSLWPSLHLVVTNGEEICGL